MYFSVCVCVRVSVCICMCMLIKKKPVCMYVCIVCTFDCTLYFVIDVLTLVLCDCDHL